MAAKKTKKKKTVAVKTKTERSTPAKTKFSKQKYERAIKLAEAWASLGWCSGDDDSLAQQANFFIKWDDKVLTDEEESVAQLLAGESEVIHKLKSDDDWYNNWGKDADVEKSLTLDSLTDADLEELAKHLPPDPEVKSNLSIEEELLICTAAFVKARRNLLDVKKRLAAEYKEKYGAEDVA